MWLLTNEESPNEQAKGTFCLVPGEYNLNRSLTSDIFCEHASISRKHACILIGPSDGVLPSTATITGEHLPLCHFLLSRELVRKAGSATCVHAR